VAVAAPVAAPPDAPEGALEEPPAADGEELDGVEFELDDEPLAPPLGAVEGFTLIVLPPGVLDGGFTMLVVGGVGLDGLIMVVC